MRRARTYSIVDHELLHGGYFQRLSHEALALYLFLAVVGDPRGKSFYSDAAIHNILNLRHDALGAAREELIQTGLISYRKPYWQVRSLTDPIAGRERASRERTQICASKKSRPIAAMVSKLMQAVRRWQSC